jgi:hypothetical protein
MALSAPSALLSLLSIRMAYLASSVSSSIRMASSASFFPFSLLLFPPFSHLSSASSLYPYPSLSPPFSLSLSLSLYNSLSVKVIERKVHFILS